MNLPSGVTGLICIFENLHCGLATTHSLRVMAERDSGVGMTGKFGDKPHFHSLRLECADKHMTRAVWSNVWESERQQTCTPVIVEKVYVGKWSASFLVRA